MYQNLVLSGGAVYGYTYIGALKALEKIGALENIKRFAGTSVGSAIAGFLACGADPKFIEREMIDLDLESLQDKTCLIADIVRLVKKYGYYRGDNAYNWFSNTLGKLTGNPSITFAEAHQRYGTTLAIVGTSLSRKEAVYFSHKTFPDMEIRLAVRISISIPLVFASIKWMDQVWVDGGIIDNFPICYFDSDELRTYSCWDGNCSTNQTDLEIDLLASDINVDGQLHQTLGLKPFSHEDYHGIDQNVTGIKSYIDNLLDTILEQATRNPLNKFNQARTVRINAGKVSSLDFGISIVQKADLIIRGEKAMEEFITNNAKYFPVQFDLKDKDKHASADSLPISRISSSDMMEDISLSEN